MKSINLIDDEYQDIVYLCDESIDNFISFCHYKEIQINNNNVIGTNYLAKKYEILSLIKITENYISEHIDELILSKLSLIANQQSLETEKYEEMLVEKLDNFIDNDQLLLLPIPVLHRIITKYNSKSHNPKVISFLFKCLDKYGQNASVLFSNIDFGAEKTTYLNILLTKYSKIFDFNYIGSALAKSLYENQSEIIQKNALIEKQQNEMMNLFQNQMNPMRQEISSMKNEYEKEIQKQNQNSNEKVNELNEIISQMRQEISSMKDEHEKEIQKQNQIYNEKISQMNDMLQNQANENEELKSTISHYQKSDKYFELLIQTINIETFNHLDGETQEFIIDEISSKSVNDVISRVQNVLAFILNEFKKKNLRFNDLNLIFIPTESCEEGAISMSKLDAKMNKIGIRSEVIEVLYESATLNSQEFKSKLDLFDQYHLEILYPSPYYSSYANNLNPKLKVNAIVADIKNFDQIRVKNFISILFKNTINSISNWSIKGSNLLTKVSIPTSVKSIGVGAFKNCSSLEQIEIPSSVTSIGSSAFRECSSLAQIEIPSSITVIESATFFLCTSLSRVQLPSSIVALKKNAFREFTSLKQISLPSSISYIDEGVFSRCFSLNRLEIPPLVTEINQNLFLDCFSLIKITIPNSVTSIKLDAFCRCSSLSSIEIPGSVESIGKNAFEKCISLSSVSIAPSLKSIAEFAFDLCYSLKVIKIPSSVSYQDNSFPSHTKINFY